MDAFIWAHYNIDALLYGCIEIHPYRDIIPDGIVKWDYII